MNSIRPANFLESFDRERHERSPWKFFVVLALLFILGLGVLFSVRGVIRIAGKMQSAKDHLLYSVTLVQNQQFIPARQNIQRARTILSDVQSDLAPWKAVSVIPFFGRQISAFTHTIEAVDRLSIAFDRAVVFAEKMVTTIVGNKPLHLQEITPEQKRLFLAQLFEASPVLQGMKADIDLAAISLGEIPDNFLLPQLTTAIAPIKKNVLQLQRAMNAALPLLEALPLVSGYPKEQRYLFLFQNNDELRPTGGFIGTYGILELRDGEIVSLFTDNIYRLDWTAERVKKMKVAPPGPVKDHLIPNWFLRDSNWSPDFPTAARQALWFYQKESDDKRPIDGVLAITPTVVTRLLQLLGPLQIDNITFTPENLVDTLQFHVEKAYVDIGLPEVERKEIIGRMTKELVNRLLTLPLGKIPDLLDIIENSLRERHVLLYETDGALQKVVTSEGWDGAVRNVPGDFLMVVDANMAALKTDSVMERSIAYSVVPEGNRLRAKVAVTYHHKGLFSWKTTRYRTYTRMYVPKGAELIRSNGFILSNQDHQPRKAQVTEELGKTVFGGYVIIEPGETKTVTLDYFLPDAITHSPYTLYVQKQAGTEAHPLLIQLKFGTTIKEWQPTGFTAERKGNMLSFPTDLRTDKQFKVEY